MIQPHLVLVYFTVRRVESLMFTAVCFPSEIISCFAAPSMPNNNDGKDLARCLDERHTQCQPQPSRRLCFSPCFVHTPGGSVQVVGLITSTLSFFFTNLTMPSVIPQLSEKPHHPSLKIPSLSFPSIKTLCFTFMCFSMFPFGLLWEWNRLVRGQTLCSGTGRKP